MDFEKLQYLTKKQKISGNKIISYLGRSHNPCRLIPIIPVISAKILQLTQEIDYQNPELLYLMI